MQSEQDLQDFAQKSSNNDMAALALIQRGDALRAELHYRSERDQPRRAGHSRSAKAQASYQQALDRKPSSPSLAAAAQYGLGLCEEELGNFDKAAADLSRGRPEAGVRGHDRPGGGGLSPEDHG